MLFEFRGVTLNHDEGTGKLYRKMSKYCKTPWKEVGCLDSYGYLQAKFGGLNCLLHRVIWWAYSGMWPKGAIDHEDHDRANNRLTNLRVATDEQNSKNKTLPITNKSGHLGVHRNGRGDSWIAAITSNGCKIYLGSFSSLDEAIAARQVANIKYGFHVNHGSVQNG